MRHDIRAGDICWLTTSSTTGHEQQGRRPVLIVTDARLTSLGMAWVVPLTTTDRGWPTHVRVHFEKRVSVAMCEQLHAVATERLASPHGAITYDELLDVRAILRSLIG